MFYKLVEIFSNITANRKLSFFLLGYYLIASMMFLLGIIIIPFLLPFAIVELTINSFKDKSCFSQADKKKILRDHIRNVLNMKPVDKEEPTAGGD